MISLDAIFFPLSRLTLQWFCCRVGFTFGFGGFMGLLNWWELCWAVLHCNTRKGSIKCSIAFLRLYYLSCWKRFTLKNSNRCPCVHLSVLVRLFYVFLSSSWFKQTATSVQLEDQQLEDQHADVSVWAVAEPEAAELCSNGPGAKEDETTQFTGKASLPYWL